MSTLPWYALAGAVLSWLTIRLRLEFADHGLDIPGHRSLHERPTPHGGGLGIIAAMLACGAWIGVHYAWLAAVFILAVLSWVDDWLHLPFWLRLAVHLAVAFGIVFTLDPSPGWAVLPFTVLIAWAINAYNFMDGADGLAGSMALVGFLAYAAGFAHAEDYMLAGFSLAIGGGAFGFLCFNWSPARIFMGDVGAIPLGFLAGGLGWYGVSAGMWPAWFPVTVFSPFIGDASLTLIRRALLGERVWEAHRDHLYQRMVRMGLGHARMCRRWLAVMIVASFLALGLLGLPEPLAWMGAIGWWGGLGAMGYRINRSWSAFVAAGSNNDIKVAG